MAHLITLVNERMRQRAIDLIMAAKPGSRVEIKGPKRSTDQNAVMWCLLSDIAEQLVWHGQKLDAEDWKLVMLDALRRETRHEMRIVPNTDLTGFVNVSKTSSSDLTTTEFSDLLTLIAAFGDQNGVVWTEPKPKDKRPTPPVEAYEEAI